MTIWQIIVTTSLICHEEYFHCFPVFQTSSRRSPTRYCVWLYFVPSHPSMLLLALSLCVCLPKRKERMNIYTQETVLLKWRYPLYKIDPVPYVLCLPVCQLLFGSHSKTKAKANWIKQRQRQKYQNPIQNKGPKQRSELPSVSRFIVFSFGSSAKAKGGFQSYIFFCSTLSYRLDPLHTPTHTPPPPPIILLHYPITTHHYCPLVWKSS